MRTIILALSLALALPAAARAQDLVGVTFRIESIAGAPATGDTATLQLMADGRVAGSSGCNRYSGPATLADGEARFGAVVSTRMACAPALMAQEQALFEAFRRTARYEAKDGALTLLDAAGAPLVRLRAR